MYNLLGIIAQERHCALPNFRYRSLFAFATAHNSVQINDIIRNCFELSLVDDKCAMFYINVHTEWCGLNVQSQ